MMKCDESAKMIVGVCPLLNNKGACTEKVLDCVAL